MSHFERGLSFADYIRLGRWNHSALKHAERSPAHAKAATLAGGADTEATVLGRAVHAVLLDDQPERIIDAPINPRTNQAFGVETKAYAEFVGGCDPSAIVVGLGMRNKIAMIAMSVREHPQARKLLAAAGDSELTCMFDYRGLACKARLDRWCSCGITPDIKTCRDASRAGFSRSVIDYSYHTQSEFYRIAARASGLGDGDFCFIAIETEPPFGVAVYSIDEPTRRVARVLIDLWVDSIKRAEDAGHFDCYPRGVIEIGAPSWYLKQFDTIEGGEE